MPLRCRRNIVQNLKSGSFCLHLESHCSITSQTSFLHFPVNSIEHVHIHSFWFYTPKFSYPDRGWSHPPTPPDPVPKILEKGFDWSRSWGCPIQEEGPNSRLIMARVQGVCRMADPVFSMVFLWMEGVARTIPRGVGWKYPGRQTKGI